MNSRKVLIAVLLFFDIQNLYALPSFSRQTGQSCASCHLSYGELTPQGRQFKLTGYSEGNYVIPLSITGVVSDTKINSTSSSIDPSITMPKNSSLIPEEASIYVAGKFYGRLGGYLKLTLNLSNTTPLLNSQGIQTGTKVGGDTYLDASEIRYANNFSRGGHNLLLGGTLNNAPGTQDLWKISPVNSYSFRSSNLLSAWEVGQFGPTALIDGGLNSQVAGVSLYAMLDDSIYAELAGYTRFSTPLKVISLADNLNTVSTGPNPYWRLAYNHVIGEDSWMVGTFGMITDLKHDPETPGSSGGEYTDIGLDAQYQHITDLHSWSAHMTYINEKIDWAGKSVIRMNHDSTHSELHTLKAELGYNYKHQLGAQVFSFYTNGSTDNNYWTYSQNVSSGACNQTNSELAFCSANGSPKTSGYGFELYYEPMSYMHFSLQQTFYDNFLGGSSFYDNSSGNLRAAKDNNLTYLYAVFSY
ncbi:hypothetical protein [Methylotenera versatilis]|uniref:Cytochrome c n=1 Tax=Methylotenera versatilis (strain 301) TaxID=666681 RepID=D7DJG8_METV0|nr:hypothetical protein [Methylotenera versatilis]ADI30203.1 cytochrome c [Methylotenera versatilis 301]